jgi:hypothetical protein
MIRRLVRGAAAVGAVLAVTLSAATAPASAESDRDGDRGDVAGQLDILSIKASHIRRLVIVVVRAQDFQRGRDYGISIGFDTKKFRARPPEYGVGFALTGTPRLVKWRRDGEHNVTVPCRGDYKTVDYRLDRVTYVVPRRCLKRPGQVRVNASTIRHNSDGDAIVVDSAPARYKYLEWLSRG